MLRLQWQRKAVDDGAKDLEELSHPVVPLRLVDEVVEDVVDIVVDVLGVSGLQQKSVVPWQSSPVRLTVTHDPTESQNFSPAPH